MHPLSRAPEPTSLWECTHVRALTPVMFFSVHHPLKETTLHTPAPTVRCSQYLQGAVRHGLQPPQGNVGAERELLLLG